MTSADARRWTVAVTGDNAAPDGSTVFGDIRLDRLTAAGIDWRVIPVPGPNLTAEQLDGFDAVLLVGGKRIDAQSFPADGRLRHVARFGAGYDAVDVDACTRAGAIVTTTPEAVRRPMAHATVALVYAVAHNLVAKDRLVREGRWADKAPWRGRGLDSSTIGILGLGGIGAETARLLTSLGLTVQAHNRTPRPELAARLGVAEVDLPTLLATSDTLVVTVAGGPGTAHLLGSQEIAAMKPGAALVNVARGSVLDEAALVGALEAGHLRAAGLDVLADEPPPSTHPLLSMPQVVLSPHALCWTDDFTDAVASSAVGALIDVAAGRLPQHPLNPAAWAGPVIAHPVD